MPRKKITSPAKTTRAVPLLEIRSIPDLAKHLGLSSWTISRAINGHPEVTEKTRQRVLAAMEATGFRPNPMARGLGGRRTGMIGVSSIGLDSPILNRKIFYLQEFLREHQLRSFLEINPQDVPSEVRAIQDFARISVDGMVLLYSTLKSSVTAEMFKGMPCVMVDPHHPQKLPTVSLDRAKAMRLLFEHLLRLEHCSFALLLAPNDPWRWPALKEAAISHGLNPDEIFRFVPSPRIGNPIEAGQVMAEEVLKWPQRPTALLTADDRMALGAIQALRHAGVEVPRQMSVTGFDNLDFVSKLHPTLTTIDQNPLQLMRRAGELLLEQIALPAKKRGRGLVEAIAPELVIGESTGPAWRP